MSPKLTYDYVKSCFDAVGYVLVSTDYINSSSKLVFICPNGHRHSIKWNDFQQGKRCGKCSITAKLTYDFAKQKFEERGCKLLSLTYKNNSEKLLYVCKCGDINSVTYANFYMGQTCNACAMKEMSIRYMGANHHNWRGGISYEPYCHIWTDKEYKNSIKKRDGEKCLNPDCWHKSKRLHVHHVDYNKKNCNPWNLITLCNSCNARANKDRRWHKAWYQAIIYRRGIC